MSTRGKKITMIGGDVQQINRQKIALRYATVLLCGISFKLCTAAVSGLS